MLLVTVLGSRHRDLGAALHPKFGKQPGQVILHRLLGQEHPLADLPVGQTLPDQSSTTRS
jgi:hypothetical protein